jgi:hypothetical protein
MTKASERREREAVYNHGTSKRALLIVVMHKLDKQLAVGNVWFVKTGTVLCQF